MKRLIPILCMVLLLCACTAAPAETTTLPETTAPAEATILPETTAPAETTAPPLPPETTIPTETTAPTEVLESFDAYYALLDASDWPNWLASSLGCLYETPYEIDLNYMFYLGVDHPGSWSDISEKSRQELLDAGFMEEMDLQIMPAEKLEDALMATFGIDLKYVAMPEEWCYIYNEDAFCSNHNDAFFPGTPTITAVEDDGTYITIHYTIESYWITTTEEFLDTAHLVLSLIRNEDGTVHAVSNLLDS